MKPDAPVRSNLYLADGMNVLAAHQLEGSGAETVLRDVSFYERDQNAMIVRLIRAPLARFAAPGWLLEQPRVFDVQTAQTSQLAQPLLLAKRVGLAQLNIPKVDANAETLGQLSHSIAVMDAAGRRTSDLRASWWHKFSGPLSATLMPLLGAVAGFGLARSGHVFARAVIGMALGFAYFVVENVALAMGSFGGYPPLLAAWGPFLLFILVGETVLVRTEE